MRRWGAILCVLALCFGLCAISAAADDFESQLKNFPASYHEGLRALHAQYPNWVFRPLDTKLEWETVLDAESAVGVNMIPADSLGSWKSCERGSYNPEKGIWYGQDGDKWLAADRSIVAWALDPRNALTPEAVFQFENLAYSDVCTADGVRAIVGGTFMQDYVDDFMKAGKEAGVSPYHLASRARQEQGKNGNGLGRGDVPGYEGYYNLFNIHAYTTTTLTAVQNGARYAATENAAYLLPWTSAALSIRGGAIILGENYINRAQNTLYLQKFDVTDGGNGYYWHQYMGYVLAPHREAASIFAAYSDEVKNGTIEFIIPVYRNMPDTPCEKPTASGSNDNWLKSLTVSGHTLTPTFSAYTAEYELVVDAAVSDITVTATPYSGGAKVSGGGLVHLQSGMNTVTLAVTAASGAMREYTLSVYRTPGGEDPQPPAPTPTLTSTRYRLEKDGVRGILPDTKAADFLLGFTCTGGTLALTDAAGESTAVVGTGKVLQLQFGGQVTASYPLIIRGDVSGDGEINALDLLKIQKHILSVNTLSGAPKLAADVNGDGQINALDLLRTQKHILKLLEIIQ